MDGQQQFVKMSLILQNIFKHQYRLSSYRAFSTAINIEVPAVELNNTQLENQMSDPKQRKLKIKQLADRYPGLKPIDVPQKLIDLSIEEIQKLEQTLKSEFGFVKEEIRFVMRHKPSFILWQENQQTGMNALQEFFVKKYGFDIELVRTLVVKYPFILSKSQDHLEKVFSLFKEQGISHVDCAKLIFECPKLVSVNLDRSMTEIFELFELYHKIQKSDVMDIFRHFPYLFCCDSVKMRILLAQFRKYRFTNQQILELCKKSNGILASKVSNFQGFFDYLKHHHDLKASSVIKLLDTYPELIMQNRRDLIRKKFDLIQNNSPNRSETYLRNLFKRHPDLFLTSLASMEAKVSYIKRNLNRQLQKEKAFPLLLHFNYTQTIWPRCELLLAQGNKHFDLTEALSGSDEEFCKRFGVDLAQLEQKRKSRKQVEEKDRLWVYVPAI